MSRPDIERLLEKAVAEAIGVPYRRRASKRPYRPQSPAAFRPMHPQHNLHQMQRA